MQPLKIKFFKNIFPDVEISKFHPKKADVKLCCILRIFSSVLFCFYHRQKSWKEILCQNIVMCPSGQ